MPGNYLSRAPPAKRTGKETKFLAIHGRLADQVAYRSGKFRPQSPTLYEN
jgi:hypothetical protein